MFKTYRALQAIYPELTWKIKTNQKVIYLTFDDGPAPDITEYALDELRSYEAKATFFCVGDNIRKHPAVFRQLLDAGHRAGNHTFNHLNGWRTPNDAYLDNIEQCRKIMVENGLVSGSGLFRPPYGRIKKSQAGRILSQYKVIMWDVLTKDYDQRIDKERRLKRCIKNAGPGSIVVFHDSYKAGSNLKYLLPRFLDHFANMGYEFHAL